MPHSGISVQELETLPHTVPHRAWYGREVYCQRQALADFSQALAGCDFNELWRIKTAVHVSRSWRSRLFDLKKAGWRLKEHSSIAVTRLRWRNLFNCPVPGVAYHKKQYRCQQRFCPFCWARDFVLPLYRRINQLLFRLIPRSTMLLDLVDTCVRHRIPASDSGGLLDVLKLLQESRSRYSDEMHKVLGKGFIPGSVRLLVPWLDFDSDNGAHWVLDNRVLFVVLPCVKTADFYSAAETLPTPRFWEKEFTLQRSSVIQRKTLPLVVSRFAKYPASWAHCPVDAAVMLFNALQGLPPRGTDDYWPLELRRQFQLLHGFGILKNFRELSKPESKEVTNDDTTSAGVEPVPAFTLEEG